MRKKSRDLTVSINEKKGLMIKEEDEKDGEDRVKFNLW